MRIQCIHCDNWFTVKGGKAHDLYPKFCNLNCLYSYFKEKGLTDNNIWTDRERKANMFRSQWEVAMSKALNEMGVGFFYEAIILNFEDGSQYLPDFYIPIENVFIEVKGLWEPGAYSKVRKAAKLVDIWVVDEVMFKHFKLLRYLK